jgi:hypothetical protein
MFRHQKVLVIKRLLDLQNIMCDEYIMASIPAKTLLHPTHILNQGTLTKREGLVQLTSSLR